jgi:Met-zincin/Domain of unknown function (DUF5117)
MRFDLSLRRLGSVGTYLLAVALIAGCAQFPFLGSQTDKATAARVPAPAAPANPAVGAAAIPGAPGAPSATPPVAPPPPNPLRPFAEVIRDAKELKGFVGVWQREERVWIELKPEQFNMPMLFAAQRSSGVGTRGLLPHWMLTNYLIEFRRFGSNNSQVQVVARNFMHQATNNPGLARVAEASFSDSLIAATVVVSQPHPQRKTVLIDMGPMLLTDLPQLSSQTEAYFRLGYGFDPRNSYFGKVQASDEQAVIEVKAHYYTPRVPLAQPGGGIPGFAAPSPPRNLEDPRSFFVTYNYSFAQLPATVMKPRQADDRLGHNVERIYEFGDEANYNEKRYYVNRWRLEKKFPFAAASEPVKPITFWLDRNIPARYLGSVKAGVLEWNKAFEKIGFLNVMRVEIEPEKDGPALAATRASSIRWYLDTDPGALAYGPSITDPRSGEILDADIAISNNWVRLLREVLVERAPYPVIGTAANQQQETEHIAHQLMHTLGKHADRSCEYGSYAAAEAQFNLQLMQMRGQIEPGSPEVEKLVNAVLKDVVMHEVGHTLGLRHNFRASTVVPTNKLNDPQYTLANGISGSVMDYNGVNIPSNGAQYGRFAMDTLGPYDYWVIEYAYRPMDSASEADQLSAIASRSSEPELAYGSDDEYRAGYDPEVNQHDLGSDPMAYAKLKFGLARELWERTQKRVLKPGESYSVLRRSSNSAFSQYDQAAELVSKYIGGVRYLRDHSGSSRVPFSPVAAVKQREAMKIITNEIFDFSALQFDPNFVARLSEDALDRDMGTPTLPGVYRQIDGLQQRVLNRLMSDSVAQRLLEAPSQQVDSAVPFTLNEVYANLQKSIWAELFIGVDIGLQRRTLQREYLKRLTAQLLRSSVGAPMDTRSLARVHAKELLEQIKKATTKKMGAEAKAHLAESLVTLQGALSAPLVRNGF